MTTIKTTCTDKPADVIDAVDLLWSTMVCGWHTLATTVSTRSSDGYRTASVEP